MLNFKCKRAIVFIVDPEYRIEQQFQNYISYQFSDFINNNILQTIVIGMHVEYKL